MLVNAEEFIIRAIAAGEKGGLESLSPLERAVFAIAEAEAYCDKDGIDGLMHRYGVGALPVFVQAFTSVGATEVARTLSALEAAGGLADDLLTKANSLITGRVGYGYESILAYVEARI